MPFPSSTLRKKAKHAEKDPFVLKADVPLNPMVGRLAEAGRRDGSVVFSSG